MQSFANHLYFQTPNLHALLVHRSNLQTISCTFSFYFRRLHRLLLFRSIHWSTIGGERNSCQGKCLPAKKFETGNFSLLKLVPELFISKRAAWGNSYPQLWWLIDRISSFWNTTTRHYRICLRSAYSSISMLRMLRTDITTSGISIFWCPHWPNLPTSGPPSPESPLSPIMYFLCQCNAKSTYLPCRSTSRQPFGDLSYLKFAIRW